MPATPASPDPASPAALSAPVNAPLATASTSTSSGTVAPALPPVSHRLEQLNTALGPLSGAFTVDWVEACDSTNTRLMSDTPADDGRVHVLVADTQHAGRGRRGRQWQSWPEGSLTFSSLWRFPAGSPAPAGLSLVAGIALARALERLGASGVQLKWPNDVLIHGEKLAGILVELLPARGCMAAVIGIGINLHLPADASIPDQAGVTDLQQALDTPAPARSIVLAAVLRELHQLLDTYARAGFTALRGAWEQRNAFANLPVQIRSDTDVQRGTCLGVDEDGALLLHTENGTRRILAGDVSLRPLPGVQT